MRRVASYVVSFVLHETHKGRATAPAERSSLMIHFVLSALDEREALHDLREVRIQHAEACALLFPGSSGAK